VEVTLSLPDELVGQLESLDDSEVRRLLEDGLRGRQASAFEYETVRDVMELLAGLPSPEQVLQLRPTASQQQRIDELLERNRSVGLSEAEEREWRQIEFLEHIVRLAKANAAARLDHASTPSV
jgi:hypothetical protein